MSSYKLIFFSHSKYWDEIKKSKYSYGHSNFTVLNSYMNDTSEVEWWLLCWFHVKNDLKIPAIHMKNLNHETWRAKMNSRTNNK